MLDNKYSKIPPKNSKNITEKSRFLPVCHNHGRDSDKKLHLTTKKVREILNYMAQDKERVHCDNFCRWRNSTSRNHNCMDLRLSAP